GSGPAIFPDATALGPPSRSNSLAVGCTGIRSITVPRVSPRFHGNEGACGTTIESPPGQNASVRSFIWSVKDCTKPFAVSQEPISTSTGISGPRCLAASRLRSEEHTSELQSRFELVCRLLLDNKIL